MSKHRQVLFEYYSKLIAGTDAATQSGIHHRPDSLESTQYKTATKIFNPTMHALLIQVLSCMVGLNIFVAVLYWVLPSGSGLLII